LLIQQGLDFTGDSQAQLMMIGGLEMDGVARASRGMVGRIQEFAAKRFGNELEIVGKLQGPRMAVRAKALTQQTLANLAFANLSSDGDRSNQQDLGGAPFTA
jgi:hypothetical protein